MWLSKRELWRLERAASDATKRAEAAEARLADERQARDTLNLAVLNWRSAKEGYPVSAHLPKAVVTPTPESRDVYFERLKAAYPAEWSYFLQVATDNGKHESEALDWLDRHHRGIPMPFETEQTM